MIQDILRTGRRYRGKALTLYRAAGSMDQCDDYAVAYLIGRQAGNAVKRNRLKRWLREDVREFQKQMSIRGQFIIRFSGRADQISHPELTEELGRIFSEIRTDA